MGNEATWQETITNNRFAGKAVIVIGAASGSKVAQTNGAQLSFSADFLSMQHHPFGDQS